jgi:hypothetical protein
VSRTWIKLWVNSWLDGTTRYEMSGAQRAFWIDLLALAGRSRCDGIICAGRNGERFTGYPLDFFKALDAGSEIDIPATFELFERTGKIKVEITSETPRKHYKVAILNWKTFQSEYDRQKGYRQGYKRVRANVTSEVTSTVTTQTTEKLLVEGEVEVEGEREANAEGNKTNLPQQQRFGKSADPPEGATRTPPTKSSNCAVKPSLGFRRTKP